jgi:predicted RNA binding protein YcfA (HicA-like mRNA interferase family)
VSNWPSTKALNVYRALLRIGWVLKRHASSHRLLSRPGYADYTFAFHDGEEIGPRMLAKISKKTGLRPEDL